MHGSEGGHIGVWGDTILISLAGCDTSILVSQPVENYQI
jgi:hypothetical protein